MNNKPLFGVAGFPINFFSSKYRKKREDIFLWLKDLNLDALEIQCTYGVRMQEEQAILYRKLAAEHGIYLTIHAPYYISLSSLNNEVVERSKLEVKKAFELAKKLGVTRIIFHPGGGYGIDRRIGIEKIINALNSIESELDTENIKIYPEIGGKVNQLGSLDEVIEICKRVKYARPCIDFGHLHAREIGSMDSVEKIVNVLKRIELELGRDILEETHFHMYPIDYTGKGEKVHKAFGDKKNDEQLTLFESEDEYLPRATDYIEAIKHMELTPVTICEAHNTQEIGAMLMKDIYFD